MLTSLTITLGISHSVRVTRNQVVLDQSQASVESTLTIWTSLQPATTTRVALLLAPRASQARSLLRHQARLKEVDKLFSPRQLEAAQSQPKEKAVLRTMKGLVSRRKCSARTRLMPRVLAVQQQNPVAGQTLLPVCAKSEELVVKKLGSYES